MNNLKRVLSLALASVMVIGMMVVGAGATDFTDADEIQHPEAVDILVGLGIVNGKEDGSYFDPTGDVTRAEMAKMIAVAMKGGNDVETGTKGVPTFTDIAGHWAESYIEYCYDLGIINGRGDGTFDPNANVTGTEATKMVLSALGYDAEAYKLKGASWATRTDELARTADPQLYTELSGVTLNKPASRDTAAQLIWNGLQNRTRKVTPTTNTNTGEVQWRYDEGDTMLKTRFDAFVYTGLFTQNSWTLSSLEKGQIRVVGDFKEMDNNGIMRYHYGTGATKDSPSTTNTEDFPADLDIAYIGEEVKVIYRNGSRSNSAGPDKNDTIYGVYVTGATKVINTTMDKIAGVDDKAALEIDKTNYDLASTVTLHWNMGGIANNALGTTKATFNVTGAASTDEATGGLRTASDTWTVSGTSKAHNVYASDASYLTLALFGAAVDDADTKFTNGNLGKRGDAVKVTFDANNKVSDLYITRSVIGQVTGVSGDRVTIAPADAGAYSLGTFKMSENDVYDDIKVDDIVVVTKLYGTDISKDTAFTTVKKAETVTGMFKGYKGTENIVVDGTTYKIQDKNADTLLDDSALDLSDNLSDLLTGEAEVELYLVNGYVGAIKEISKTNTNYSVITNVSGNNDSVDDTFNPLKIEVMGADGTKTTLTVADSSKSDVSAGGDDARNLLEGKDVKKGGQLRIGDIVTYSIKSNGKADVRVVGAVNKSANDAKYDKDTKSVYMTGAKKNAASATSNVYVTSGDAVLFVQTANTPIDGANFSGISGTKFKAYKIRDVKDLESTAVSSAKYGTVALDNDGKVVAAFLNYATASSNGTEALYGIVTSKVGSVRMDGTDYTQYKVSANGETYVLNFENNPGWKDRAIVYFTPKADNIYDYNTDSPVDYTKCDAFQVKSTYQLDANGKPYTEGGWASENNTDYATLTWIKEYDAKSQIITVYTGDGDGNVTGNTYTYSVDSDAKVFYVSPEAKSSSETGSVSKYDTTTGNANAILVVEQTGTFDSDGNPAQKRTVKAIIVDIERDKDRVLAFPNA